MVYIRMLLYLTPGSPSQLFGPIEVDTDPPLTKQGDENTKPCVLCTSLARYARPRSLIERKRKVFSRH